MELHHFWIQVRELTLASLKSRYRKTFAGFFWVVLNPLIMFGVQSLVFRTFLKIQVSNYYLFLVGGLLPWIFFSQTVQMGTPLFVTQSHLLRSFKINPLVILFSQVMDNFINFIASFLLILIPVFIIHNQGLSSLILLPIAMVPLLIGAVSLTITLSIVNVFFRDINFIMGFLFSILFFVTPVFYPKAYVPAEWQWLVEINPIVYFIEPFRSAIYSEGLGFWPTWLKGLGISMFFVVVAIVVWNRKRNAFYIKL